MARRGCASGRRKQLRRLVKALHEHKEFNPDVFDRATPTLPPPPPPAYTSYTQPQFGTQIVKPILTKQTSQSRKPARPSATDVAPVRRQTRPLPVSAQIKKRGIQIVKSANKPAIISIKTTKLNIQRAGNKIIIKRIPPILHEKTNQIVTCLTTK